MEFYESKGEEGKALRSKTLHAIENGEGETAVMAATIAERVATGVTMNWAPEPIADSASSESVTVPPASWMTIEPAEQLRWKRRLVVDALERLGGVGVVLAAPFLHEAPDCRGEHGSCVAWRLDPGAECVVHVEDCGALHHSDPGDPASENMAEPSTVRHDDADLY